MKYRLNTAANWRQAILEAQLRFNTNWAFEDAPRILLFARDLEEVQSVRKELQKLRDWFRDQFGHAAIWVLVDVYVSKARKAGAKEEYSGPRCPECGDPNVSGNGIICDWCDGTISDFQFFSDVEKNECMKELEARRMAHGWAPKS